MKTLSLWITLFLFLACAPSSFAQEDNSKYIEVTGTSEITIVPDEIHYIIEIREYWEEEFEKSSKPENYRTKVQLSTIENSLRKTLRQIGIPDKAIRTLETGNYWRETGKDFLIAKQFDITLNDFNQIDKITRNIDTKGINTMRIGELKNKDIQAYRKQGKIEALKAAKEKAAYLAEALNKQVGDVIRIIEPQESMNFSPFSAQSNVLSSQAQSFDSFRTIKLRYSMTVRFEIAPNNAKSYKDPRKTERSYNGQAYI